MKSNFRVQVYMVGVDKDRAKQLRKTLRFFVRGAGRETKRDMMRRAHEGERVLVYETNDDEDAKRAAQSISDGGATVEIDGLKPPEEPF